ncbi:CRAL-TRIO domain-containing protein [Caerostris extrusa]|uniref:CRAL-TRIO domain-containing protein n=1 Tax=Caerostris extrusa TaxID=172846 RepID=A0AAV4QQE3_CAEEX|nr:CRAL-TRIO domain-containing protein [Caerostris extrusa]
MCAKVVKVSLFRQAGSRQNRSGTSQKNPFHDIPARVAVSRKSPDSTSSTTSQERDFGTSNTAPLTYVFSESFNSLNGNYLMNLLISLIKPLMPEEFRRIIFVHSSPEDLLKHFPSSVLPVKYGGKQTDYYAAEWLRKANEQQDNFPAGGQKTFSDFSAD